MRFWITLTLAFFVCCGSAAAAESDYGQFFNDGENVEVFSDDIDSFNDKTLDEQTSFLCLTPDGEEVSAWQSKILSDIFLAASDVYSGEFSYGTASEEPGDRTPANGGFATGTSGMQQFLRSEKRLLEDGKWVSYDMRTLTREEGRNSYPSSAPGWNVNIEPSSSAISRSQGASLSSLINDDASNPLMLTENIPAACAISPLEPDSPSIAGLFSNSGDFFTDMILYPPAKLASAAYDFIQPFTFRYTFYTPHSEKGDLFWDVPASCAPGDTQCSAKPQGYESSTPVVESSKPWFLAAAQFTQWLVSGLYFLTIFVAVALFIMRGNRATTFKLMTVIPRLIGSIGLTVMAGFLIGLLITFSNTLVQVIFEWAGDDAIANINTFLLQSGNIVGGPAILQNLTTLVVGAMTAFFFFVFVVFTLARQVLLVIALILAPAASFCLVSPKWQGRFTLYLRALLVIIFMPVILTFILVVGMNLNPLAQNPEQAYGQIQGSIGLIVMMITFYLMYKAIRLSKDYVLSGSVMPEKPTSVKETLSSFVPRAPEQPQIATAHSKVAVAGGPSLALGPGGSGEGGASSGGGAGAEVSGGGGMPNMGRNSVSAGIGAFQKSRKAIGNRISKTAARRYMDGRNKAIGAMEARLSRRLKPEEVEQLKKAYSLKQGGRLVQQNGKFYLTPEEPVSYEGKTE